MLRPAPFFHRCAAFLLDGLLLLLGAAAITTVTNAPLLGAGSWQKPDGLSAGKPFTSRIAKVRE